MGVLTYGQFITCLIQMAVDGTGRGVMWHAAARVGACGVTHGRWWWAEDSSGPYCMWPEDGGDEVW